MIKYFSFLLLLTINTCNCGFKGSYSKVIWNSKNKSFQEAIMNVDESSISFNVTKCKKNNRELILSGRVIDENILAGNKDELSSEAIILKCNKYGKIQDTLLVVKKDGLFIIKTPNDNDFYLVLKLINKQEGLKYNIRDF